MEVSRSAAGVFQKAVYALGGVPTRDIVRMLASEQGRTDIDPPAFAALKEEAYFRRFAHVGPVEEVVAIAKEHRGRIPMGVASGGSTMRSPASCRTSAFSSGSAPW